MPSDSHHVSTVTIPFQADMQTKLAERSRTGSAIALANHVQHVTWQKVHVSAHTSVLIASVC